jgi:uncharacterized protein (TIGR00369 family)
MAMNRLVLLLPIAAVACIRTGPSTPPPPPGTPAGPNSEPAAVLALAALDLDCPAAGVRLLQIYDRKFTNGTDGVMHGGALMSLADSAGAVCAFLNLPQGATTSTIESKTNFFRALRSGRALAVSTPLHAGRTTIVVQTDLRDEDGKRVALVTQTQAVLCG